MKKLYNEPIMAVSVFDAEDVVTTSGTAYVGTKVDSIDDGYNTYTIDSTKAAGIFTFTY